MQIRYEVTIKNYAGSKIFYSKHKLRGWLMNFLKNNDIKDMNITKEEIK